MKQLLIKVGISTILAFVSILTSVAANVTFSYSDYKGQGTSSTGSEYTMTKTEVSISNNKFYCGSSSSYAQFYANGTTTITPASGVTISSVVLTAYNTSYNGFQSSGSFTASIGSVSGSTSSTTVTWTGSATSAFTISNNKQIRWTSIVVTYTTGGGTPTCATPTFSPAAGTYKTTQSVTISTETDGATIYYTTDNTTPTASSSVYSSAISVSSNTTIKAIAVKASYNNSSVASADYNFISLEHAGTELDPYSVADARIAIDANAFVTDVYATGIVSQIVTAYNSENGNISYNISADGTTSSDQLQAYRGKSYNGENFTSADDIQVGDVVVLFGNLTKYSSTYEFAANNRLVSLDRPAVPAIVVGSVSLSGFKYEEGSGPSEEKSFIVSGSNLTDNITVSLSGSDYEISLASGSGYTNTLTLTQTAGSVSSTTIYARLKAGKGVGDYSNTVTLSSTGATDQTVTLSGTVTERPVPADLPFSFNGGREGIGETNGIYQEGLGTDYGSAPKLKFDSTGDYVLLLFDERPGVLTFDIKNNSFSGGTFKVQTSEDGSSYTDLEVYNTISGTQSEEFTSIDADVRYIKWIYTTKSSGNVGLGNISLAKYVAPVPSIAVSSDNIDVSASAEDGTLDITYENLSISDESDFAVQFFDSESNEISDPSWLAVIVEENGAGGYRVAYDIDANTGASRTAYFKVWAFGDVDPVYSNLVTVNQAGVHLSYAVLPFAFNDGSAAVANKDGLSQSGLGSDYSTAENTKLKLDTTGDNLVLRINEAPGILTFSIKGNGFSGGTFSVQVSADGSAYSDVASYTELTGSEVEKTISDLASNVRYIKWVYTEKVNGNVGLGNISLTKPASNPATITITATENGGKYYTTFYNGSARYVLPAGAKAFTMNSDHELYQLGADGSIIPTGTAVIIIAENASITLTKSDGASAITVNGGANILQGSNSPKDIYSISGTPYVLGIVTGTLGFYEFTGDGIPAYKAYYEN